MRAYAELNDRANVARVYAELQSRLKTELNTTPMSETGKLYGELTGRK